MIHDYDALNWIFGAPQAVTARGMRNSRSGGFDQVQVLIDYAGGTSALVDGGMMMPESYPFPHDSKSCAKRVPWSTPSAPVAVASRWAGESTS